jgi:hypothetical protein
MGGVNRQIILVSSTPPGTLRWRLADATIVVAHGTNRTYSERGVPE